MGLPIWHDLHNVLLVLFFEKRAWNWCALTCSASTSEGLALVATLAALEDRGFWNWLMSINDVKACKYIGIGLHREVPSQMIKSGTRIQGEVCSFGCWQNGNKGAVRPRASGDGQMKLVRKKTRYYLSKAAHYMVLYNILKFISNISWSIEELSTG